MKTSKKITLIIGAVAILVAGFILIRLWIIKSQKDIILTQMSSYAINGKDHELQRMLSNKEFNVNQKDPFNNSLLYYAVKHHHLSTVHLLLKAGANPNTPENINSPLSYAIGNSDTEIVKELLDYGAHLDWKIARSLSHVNDTELIKLVLSYNTNSYDLLYIAASFDNKNLLRLSLQALTNGSGVKKDDKTVKYINLAIASAKRYGHTDAVEILEEYKTKNFMK